MGTGPAPLSSYQPAQKYVQTQNQAITWKNRLQTLITRKCMKHCIGSHTWAVSSSQMKPKNSLSLKNIGITQTDVFSSVNMLHFKP